MQILTINTGSSSLKASLFMPNGSRLKYHYNFTHNNTSKSYIEAFNGLLEKVADLSPQAIGHRFVHGGEILDHSRILDATEISRLKSISYLAPLHMGPNLFGVEYLSKHFNVPQVACFDTSFHATLPESAWRLPIPNTYHLRRYGFHGINYAHIARVLPDLIGNIAKKNIVVAHLGSGSSLCLIKNLISIDTSMGFTPAGGIPMATRSGDLDPGVMLELAKTHNQDQLTDLVYRQMGLIALSNNESSDMSQLLKSNSLNAQFAVEYYCRQVCASIGAFAAKASGVDALVFTAGIGENSAEVRSKICDPLNFLGFTLNENANQINSTVLNIPSSKPVLIIPADEESEICRLTTNCVSA
ncbi:MAG: acetate kinase [Methylotenera sp.]|nr:MAG: acetate kinase [Methylotenera sp.]PPD54241.1 MAG: acetate kinase [Methylotenera sp.]